MLEVKEEVERGVVFLEKLGLCGIFSCLVELYTDILYTFENLHYIVYISKSNIVF